MRPRDHGACGHVMLRRAKIPSVCCCGNGRMTFWKWLLSAGCEFHRQPNVDTMECRPTDVNLDLRLPRFPEYVETMVEFFREHEDDPAFAATG